MKADTIASIQHAGYTERQSRFLYLAATHSGYFLSRHFFRFASSSDGKAFRSFIAKARDKRHVRDELHAENGARRYHIFSKPLYARMGKENSSNRRKHQVSKIIVKLQTLDFVLAHTDVRFLEEEADKLRYFEERLGVPRELFPARVYPPKHHDGEATTRYFVDKFPVFIARDNVTSFVFIDDPLQTTQAFATYLFQYLSLFRSLASPFRVFFASPISGKFNAAERTFHAVMASPADAVFEPEVLEYFDLRRRWEAEEISGFTPELLRKRVEAAKKFTGAHYESLYRRWLEFRKASTAAPNQRRKNHGEFIAYKLPD